MSSQASETPGYYPWDGPLPFESGINIVAARVENKANPETQVPEELISAMDWVDREVLEPMAVQTGKYEGADSFGEPDLLRTLLLASEVEALQDAHADLVVRALVAYPDTVALFPLHGALPLFVRSMQHGSQIPKLIARMHAVDLSRNVGMASGSSKKDITLPGDVLDRRNIVLIVDDILDTGRNNLDVAWARLLNGGEIAQAHGASILVSDISKTGGVQHDHFLKRTPYEDPKFSSYIDRTTWYLTGANIVDASLFNKNPTLTQRLLNYSPGEGERARLQRLFSGQARSIDQWAWVMGASTGGIPCLDTKITGAQLLACNPQLAGIITPSMQLRAGAGIESLVVLNPQKFDDFIATYAHGLATYLN